MQISSEKKTGLSGWTMLVMVIALLIALPIISVLSGLFADARSVWQHLAETVLSTYVINSLLLMVWVALGVGVIGTGTAWLVTMCRFPGSRILTWALLIPLAAPAYILAYTYTDLLDYYGIVQMSLRSWFGWKTMQDYWFPNVRSLWGAALMLVLVLYPYVYLLARSAFLSQSVCTIEASRSLGCSPWQSFRKVALPLARPAIVAGLSLALMETLNDYATVQFFEVSTFTTGIYRTWFGMGERLAATQLSAFLLMFIFALILLEQLSRGRGKYYQSSGSQSIQKYQLRGLRAIAALLFCLVPLLLGFFVPGGFLLKMTLDNWEQAFDQRFWDFASNSLIVSGLAAGVAIVIGIILAYGLRLNRSITMRIAAYVASMGYAVPGSVIAVGVLVPFGLFDNAIDSWMRSTFNISTGLLLSGTIFALIFAYLVRFLALSFNSIEASLTNIKPSLDDASRSLGFGATNTLFRIHIPLLWKGVLAAAILVFVDVMKELSATLIIRPFNFDTLAVHVYNLASDERLAEASGSALAIVLVGLIPVMLLSWQMEKR
ncbi:iron ABC transporter permease [Leptolyngbya sp. FACHB-17]|uniref:ABC transporter permease n=1 Tax=unclassified Leptolyngbya TaxID=2650499 RepID=UPI001681059A|nr:iron ABC transporter permease [Leptolyngbya sp. FACHB-17]MBD2078872.1 iron ABC transporter permease [Leptolyngbya sp. FACHB-17]